MADVHQEGGFLLTSSKKNIVLVVQVSSVGTLEKRLIELYARRRPSWTTPNMVTNQLAGVSH